jgi:hypothetical protein
VQGTSGTAPNASKSKYCTTKDAEGDDAEGDDAEGDDAEGDTVWPDFAGDPIGSLSKYQRSHKVADAHV